MGESYVARKIARLKALEDEKRPWLDHYQRLAEIFLTRKADFTNTQLAGAFLNDDVFTNVPQYAADLYASVCKSMIWPDAARSFVLIPKPQIAKLPGVEAYFKAKTARVQAVMDNPEAGFSLASDEYLRDEAVFGTAGIATHEGPEDDFDLPVVYKAWDVKHMYIDENRRGYVDTIYVKESRTVRQVYDEYVINSRPGDKISVKVKELYDQRKYDEKIVVLVTIEPNERRDAKKKGIAAMRYSTCHIDVTNKTQMRESGYHEIPGAIGRAAKRAGEKQGRSRGMIALPAAVNLNSLSQDIIVASEKNLKPPLLVLDDGRLGGAVIDTSADGMVVVNTAGRPFQEKPIQPLYTVGDPALAKDHKTQLIEEIMQAFGIDRLLDLNNKTMMTAYEAAIRNRLRGEASGSDFTRQIMEVFIPTIQRTINILMRRGDLGDFPGVSKDAPGVVRRRRWVALGGKDDFVIPESIRAAVEADLDIYDIKFISPAQRFMQAEKLQGLMTSMDAKIAVAALRPDILDGTDLDQWARDVDEFAGAPNTSQRTVEDLKKYRAETAKRQEAADMLGAGGAAADIGLKSAKARQALGTMGDK